MSKRTSSNLILLTAALLEIMGAHPAVASLASEDSSYFVTHHEANQDLTLGLNFDFLNTTSNYSASGASSTPAGLGHANHLDLRALASYGLNDRWSVFGVLDLRRADTSSAPPFNGTSYGLGDQTAGANFQAYQDGLVAIDLQFALSFAAYGNGSHPSLGDGSEDFTWGAFARIPLFSDFIFLKPGAGFTYRNEGYSSDIPWSIQLAYESSSPWTANVGFMGQQSLGTDGNTPYPQSSFITGAVNPSFVSVDAQLGYRLNPDLEITVGGNQSFYGENSPDEYALGVGVVLRWGRTAATTPLPRPSQATSPEYDLEATVLSVNDSFHLAKIDRGSNEGLLSGDAFDVFDPQGNRIAECRVTNLKPHEAALKVKHYFRETWVVKGDTARRKK